MAARNVTSAISRTAIAIASLMVAVSVIIGLQSMIGSFRNTVQSWLGTLLTADVYITPTPLAGRAAGATMDPAIIAQLRHA